MKHYEINGLERISKANARTLYNIGFPIVFCPCNLKPGFPYNPEYTITKPNESDYYTDSERSFEYHVNSFEFYNCTSTETGKYIAFYVPSIVTIHFQINDSNPVIYRDCVSIQIARIKKYLKLYRVDSVENLNFKFSDIYMIHFTEKG